MVSGEDRRLDSRYCYTDWKEGELHEVDGLSRILRFYKVDVSPHGLGGYFVGKLPKSLYSDYYIFKKGVGRIHYQLTWFFEESMDSFRFGLKLIDSYSPSYLYGYIPKRFRRIRQCMNKNVDIGVKKVI